ncbi:conserved Plasmodium protein, unknown function [Plasmodium gallinaceum]|uniref:Fam-m protein n=1 Tax=Plasmodium gallinaceum TaxID=5849 RepID=A0A1J1GX07_PLAGA|nr:conserved Plasmodium protein, unknown function [Plasmodium gallinaceum]CRG96846.1 conserved Plasmodium protein, unknown function [Plasmodium gallinaceum]
MILFTFIFHFMSFLYLCFSYTINKKYVNKLKNISDIKIHGYFKNSLCYNSCRKNKLFFIYSNKYLVKKNFQTYKKPRVKITTYLFREVNVGSLFPGFKTIFNKKFLFEPLYSSHKDIIIRNIKTINLIQKDNVVKNILIFSASCFTIFLISKLLILLRNFFQNQYKMISEQEIQLLGKYENPHIEFND